jgi:hypothetical protein
MEPETHMPSFKSIEFPKPIRLENAEIRLCWCSRCQIFFRKVKV